MINNFFRIFRFFRDLFFKKFEKQYFFRLRQIFRKRHRLLVISSHHFSFGTFDAITTTLQQLQK